MLCFSPDVKNEDELLKLLKQGSWDKDIFEYLIEIMADKDNKLLDYDPVDLFEMQATLKDENELLNFQFWNIDESGIYENRRYTLNQKQREFFDLFVLRIRDIYQLLQKLVVNN